MHQRTFINLNVTEKRYKSSLSSGLIGDAIYVRQVYKAMPIYTCKDDLQGEYFQANVLFLKGHILTFESGHVLKRVAK